MARVRPSSGRDTSTPSATSGVEDLSAKMARLHSPMKDVDDVVTPRVATCVGRSLNMAFSAAPNVTERKSVVPTSTKDASGSRLEPLACPVPGGACFFRRCFSTGDGNGRGNRNRNRIWNGIGSACSGYNDGPRPRTRHDGKHRKDPDGPGMSLDQGRAAHRAELYWKTEWVFPSGDVLERESLLRARDFVCMGMHGCRVGDCCSRVESHDIFKLRS